MRLKKFEIVLICTAVLLAVFTAGFIIGRNTAKTTVTVSGTASFADASGETTGKININTCDSNDLTSLPGIGRHLADAIITYRNEHGDFSSISDLINIDGIGGAVYEAIRAYITV